MTQFEALVEVSNLTKAFGGIEALRDVSLSIRAGRVTCVLGDNGAGKSTLVQILSGAVKPDSGSIWLQGRKVVFRSPCDALSAGIATVFQDLAVVQVMPVYRNFFLGNEPVKGHWPFSRFDKTRAIATTLRELREIGVELEDVTRPIVTLSGGQRQCVAIARAVHWGAKILILDEPTSSLGVRQSSYVLKQILDACHRGVGIILITHNPEHAYAVGDTFIILKRGQIASSLERTDVSIEQLARHMSDGEEVASLARIRAGDVPS